jgi:hypothetical protein
MIMRLRGLSFLAAKDYLVAQRYLASAPARPAAAGAAAGPRKPAARPSAWTAEQAHGLAILASRRLWTPEGAADLEYARARGLADGTVRAFMLGSCQPNIARHPGSNAGIGVGITIPWADSGRLVLLKIRRHGALPGPKYEELFRDAPVLYATPKFSAGRPVIITEGEFDCMLLCQEFGGRVPICTLGSAGAPVTPAAVGRLAGGRQFFIATDADPAGEAVAEAWLRALPARTAVRIRPPGSYNDWSDAHM